MEVNTNMIGDSFENRGSYNASTKGHMSNLGVFGILDTNLMKIQFFYLWKIR